MLAKYTVTHYGTHYATHYATHYILPIFSSLAVLLKLSSDLYNKYRLHLDCTWTALGLHLDCIQNPLAIYSSAIVSLTIGANFNGEAAAMGTDRSFT